MNRSFRIFPVNLMPIVLLSSAGLWIAGCATTQPTPELPFHDASRFTLSGESEIQDKWWRAFDDSALEERIEAALRNNLTIEQAWERLIESRHLLKQAGAAQAVAVDWNAGVSGSDGSSRDGMSELSIGLAASYEVDIWGKIRNQVQAEDLRSSMAHADYQATSIIISGQVAMAWYELIHAKLQRDLLEQQLTTNLQVLEVIEARFGVGQTGSADVLRQRQLIERTRAQIIQIVTDTRIIESQLAVLEGRLPQDSFSYEYTDLPKIPEFPHTGVGSELVLRRPDVLSAEIAFLVADKELQIAVKEQYPSLSLTASISTMAENPSGLLDAWIGSVAAQLAGPLLDGDRLKSEVDRLDSVRRRQVAGYGEVILSAFQEIENAITRETNQARTLRNLETQLDLAQKTSEQLRSQYIKGAVGYLDVLTSLLDEQRVEREVLTANRDLVLYRIALYRSLAGGFEVPLTSNTKTNAIEVQSHGS